MRKPAILTIDDEPSMLLLLNQVLKKEYTIITTTDGLKAMAWLSQGNKPDLIITDISMPNLDGINLIKNLRCSTKFCEIPIIVLSANDSEEHQDLAFKNGVFDYLIKPFDPTKLKNLVSYALTPINIF